MVLGTCHLQGRQPLPWGRSLVSFGQISLGSVFQGKSWDKGPSSFALPRMVHHPWLAAPKVIWGIYSHLYCSSRDGGRDLLSSGEAAPTMGKVPTGHWWGTILSSAWLEGPLTRFPLKNWIWANLLKTDRGPAPWWGLPPLKTSIPYHHPPWSSAGVSKCAKSHPELLAIDTAPFICCIDKMTKNFVAFDLPNVTIPLTTSTE